MGTKGKGTYFKKGQKKAWAVSVGGYIFSHKSSVYDPGKVMDLAHIAVQTVLPFLLTELKQRIKFFFKKFLFSVLALEFNGKINENF